VHPLFVRITHWVNAIAVFIMLTSGWQIYNASPLFPFTFPPSLTLGGWLAGGLLWHFAGMWLFAANGLLYLLVGARTAHFRRKFLPLRPRDVVRDLSAALTGRLSHANLAVYNAVQKLCYVGVLVAGLIMVGSGLALWKPVQLERAGGAVWRLRGRPARALLRHALHCAFPRHPRADGPHRAAQPARHDLGPLRSNRCAEPERLSQV
jgi:thiosulfate reductase cytochrome b subunit